MAKRIVHKAEKRKRVERFERRKINKIAKKSSKDEKDVENLVRILKGESKRKHVALFSSEEKIKHFAKLQAIGKVNCPCCNKSDVIVANPDGEDGDPEFDYIMRHNGIKSVLCEASLKSIHELFELRKK